MKKFIISALGALVILSVSIPVQAQFGLGISYEERADTPKQGFGLQLEHELLPFSVITSLRARVHFSYFSDNASLSVPVSSQPSIELGTIQNYDYGGAIIGGLNLGLLSPYIGLGISIDNWKFEPKNYNETFDEQTIQYYGLFGASLSVLPVIHPFIEYRVSEYGSIKEIREQMDEGRGRFIIGVSFRF